MAATYPPPQKISNRIFSFVSKYKYCRGREERVEQVGKTKGRRGGGEANAEGEGREDGKRQ